MNTVTDHINIWITAQTQKSMGRNRGIDNIHQHGVKRLRSLILELAVRGKLISQDPNDESLKILLSKIKLDSGNIITELVDNIPFQLPKGWIWSKFSDVALLRHGHQFMKHDFVENGIPVVKIGQCKSDGTLDLSQCDYIGEDRLEEFKDYLINKGDLLMALTGGTLGKVTRVDRDYGIVVQNYRVGNFFTNERILTINFLNVILQSDLFQNLVKEKINQNAQPNIGKDNIEKISLPIPPLAEQHRIVAKVDELMALCDKLEQQQTASLETHQLLVETLLKTLTDAKDSAELNQAWQQIESNFNLLFTTEESVDLLKQTILQLAVMGKLTQDFRKQNPELVSGANSAHELLKKIAAEKEKLVKAGKIKKQNPLPEITDDEKPFELPEGWEFVRLGEIANKIGSGSTPRGGNSAYTDSGTIFLRSQNIRNEGLLLDEVAYITDKTNDKMSNTIVFPNDILLNITGGSLGRCAIFPENLKMANVSQHVTIIRLTSLSSVRYMHLSILSPYIQNLIWGRQVGANREGLSKKILELFEIPIPPLDEQLRIVAKVDELFALCDALKERIDESQKIKIKLADAVVENAVKDIPAGKVIYTANEQLSIAAEPE